MASEINFNPAEMLMLENQIRVSVNSNFNAQDAYETTFEDVLLEQTSKHQEQIENKFVNKINFSNLGMPAGFILDTSLLEESV